MAFYRLPIETHIHIASYLGDRDIASYSRICKETNQAINCIGSPLWRNLFKDKFDLSRGFSNNDLKKIYQLRTRVLRKTKTFKKGLTPKEKTALIVLRELVVESYIGQTDETKRIHSNNLDTIQKYVNESSFLRNILVHTYYDKQTNPLLLAIQIALVHFQFSSTAKTHGFLESQRLVYQAPHTEPVFTGRQRTDINMHWMLNCLNFFKNHCCVPGAALADCYRSLPDHEVIQPWKRPLCAARGARELGEHWKGVYGAYYGGNYEQALPRTLTGRIAYLQEPEVDLLRQRSSPPENLEDRWCDSEDILQSLDIQNMNPSDRDVPWNTIFEEHCHALSHPSVQYMRKHASTQGTAASSKTNTGKSPPRTTRAQVRNNPEAVLDSGPETVENLASTPSSIQNALNQSSGEERPLELPFKATGMDEELFLASGWVTALPPQQGIPGWQRFTMVKFFIPDWYDFDPELDSLEELNLKEVAQLACAAGIEGLWCYEGIVLPGGNVTVGRWWSPATGSGLGMEKPDGDGAYSGPFFWWCVD